MEWTKSLTWPPGQPHNNWAILIRNKFTIMRNESVTSVSGTQNNLNKAWTCSKLSIHLEFIFKNTIWKVKIVKIVYTLWLTIVLPFHLVTFCNKIIIIIIIIIIITIVLIRLWTCSKLSKYLKLIFKNNVVSLKMLNFYLTLWLITIVPFHLLAFCKIITIIIIIIIIIV